MRLTLCICIVQISPGLNRHVFVENKTKQKQSDLIPHSLQFLCLSSSFFREHSGSVVECLTGNREAAGLSLTGVTVLWSLSKTHLF